MQINQQIESRNLSPEMNSDVPTLIIILQTIRITRWKQTLY